MIPKGLPKVLPAEISAAEFARVFSGVAGPVILAPFGVAVVGSGVQAESGGIAVLLIPDSAERHAFLSERALVAKNGVVLFTARLRPREVQEPVFGRVVHNH